MRTPKLTATRRAVLEAVAGGHVEAEYVAACHAAGEVYAGESHISADGSGRWFGDFYRTDVERNRRVSKHVATLIAAGLATTDNSMAFPAESPFSFDMVTSPVILTEAGRVALGMSAKPAVNLTPTMRAIAEAVAGGHVTGMFSSQYDVPRWRAVPAIEGTRVGQFERSDCHRYYSLVTDEVVTLIAGGYAAVERAGDFYTHTSAQHEQYVAAGLDDTSKRCDVVVVLTAVGREALGLAPIAEPAPEVAEPAPAVEVATAAAKPSRARKPRKPCASALAIAARLSSNPDQAAGVHAEETGFRKSTVTTTLRRMIAAGEVIEVEDFDGSPLYYLAEVARERYATARPARALALAA